MRPAFYHFKTRSAHPQQRHNCTTIGPERQPGEKRPSELAQAGLLRAGQYDFTSEPENAAEGRETAQSGIAPQMGSGHFTDARNSCENRNKTGRAGPVHRAELLKSSLFVSVEYAHFNMHKNQSNRGGIFGINADFVLPLCNVWFA